MKLVTAILAKNEADRYLERVLACCAEFSDRILVLDDNSNDATPDVALACPKVTLKRRKTPTAAWGAEGSARAELWTEGAKLAGDGWLLICDADMVLQGDPRPYCYSWEMNSWAWGLVDLWDSEETFRIDGPWQYGPRTPRPWLFQPSAANGANLTFGPPDAMGRKNWKPQWQDRGIHVGHCPGNFPLKCGVAPDLLWLHYAYLKSEHRKSKLAAYMAVKDQLSPFELAHAASIAD